MKRQSVQKAYRNIRPDAEAKVRMLNNILLSSEIPPAGKDDTMKQKKIRPMVLVAIIALIAAMTVTAFASEEIAGWFEQYFAKQSDTPLTTEQIEFIEKNEQIVAETQLQNNCTVELKSFMTDGKIALMTIHVTAPEGMNITDAQIGNWAGHGEHYIFQPVGETYWASGIDIYPPMDDGDGKDNTVDILCELTGHTYERPRECTFAQGTTWKVLLEDVVVMCENTEYLSQFEVDENGGIDLTWEQSQLAYPTYTLVEGVWEYEFTITEGDFRTIELLEEPIPMTVEYNGKSTNHVIESMELRSMTLTVFADPMVNSFSDGSCFVVLKDGTEIEMVPRAREGSEAENWVYSPFLAESPIPLDEVDYVMLCGVKTEVP